MSDFAAKFAKNKSSSNDLDLVKNADEKLSISQKILQERQQKNTAKNIVGETDEEASVSPDKVGKSDLIYLVKGVDQGRNAWYYVLVERLKLSLFLKALNDDIIHLENYGEILYSAYGDEPSKEITDKVKKEYGIK